MARARAGLLRSEELLLAGGDPARTAALAAECGATPVSVGEALASAPDGVVVASSTERHAEQLLAAAELGVPVLCEKPIALTVADTRAAVDALARSGATVQVGFQRRFDPEIAAARAAGVGTLYSLRITARDAEPSEERYILGRNVARPATVSTDGWSGYAGLDAAGYRHQPLNLSATWGDAARRLPAIHLVFGLAKRWLLGTHHGAVGKKHLPAYLDEFVFRFNRRTARSIAHRFARVIQQAVLTPPATYRDIVAGRAT
jgi:transposase-like protein